MKTKPTKIDTIDLDQLRQLAMDGKTMVEMAKFFKISTASIYNYQKDNPKFLEAIKDGKKDADNRVERALYERACGYSHPEEKIFCSDGFISRANTTKHYPPDTAAAFIWLKNRQSGKWKDKHEMDLTLKGSLYAENEKKSTADLNREAVELAQAIVKESRGTSV